VLRLNSAIRPIAISALITGLAGNLSLAKADPVVPYKSNWMQVKATDGSIYEIDKKSILHFSNGTSELVVYAAQDGPYDPRNVRRLWFDCQGNFQDHTAGASPTEHAQPGSMAAKLSDIACSRATDRNSTVGQIPDGSRTATPSASRYSARQTEAIRMTHIAGWADKHCAGITSAPTALGDDLIDVGIEFSDFDTPEFKQITRDADSELDEEPIQARCEKLWSMFGPGGAYGRQLVRLRRPSDPLIVQRQ
jgi:hypothetical protein